MDKREEVGKLLYELEDGMPYGGLSWGHIGSDAREKYRVRADAVIALFAAPTVGESSPGGEEAAFEFWFAREFSHWVEAGNVGVLDKGAFKIAWMARAALSPSKARVVEDGGDATPGMDLEALIKPIEWMEWWVKNNDCDCEFDHFCGKPERQSEINKARASLKRLRQSPPKGDPAAPSLLAGGRENSFEQMRRQAKEDGMVYCHPCSESGKAEMPIYHKLPACPPPAQAGAQGDATGGEG